MGVPGDRLAAGGGPGAGQAGARVEGAAPARPWARDHARSAPAAPSSPVPVRTRPACHVGWLDSRPGAGYRGGTMGDCFKKVRQSH